MSSATIMFGALRVKVNKEISLSTMNTELKYKIKNTDVPIFIMVQISAFLLEISDLK